MWRWATSSDGRLRAARRAVLAGLLLPGGLAGQTFLTQEEALRLAFPEPASIERRTAFLEESGLEAARRLAGADVPVKQRIVTYYVGKEGERVLGFAYFDAHRVRTLPEVLMVLVSPEARVERIEVLKFGEPREYLPPARWLGQFENAGLEDRLASGGEIINLTGATLTSRAVTRAARRVLALHEVIHGADGDDAGRSPGAGAHGGGRR
ncbi:MAG: FMN-binding protein [Gemmatimonadota bacterium]